jgi:hypothetical protein
VTAINAENTSVAAVSEHPAHSGGFFDYTKMNPSTADFLRGAATVIRSCQESWAREVIRIGTYLRGAKAHLPHGQFNAWLKAEFNWTVRTGQNYMRAAQVFGTKCETVSHLPLRLIHKLAAPSTPKQIQDRVVADLEAGKSIDHRAITKEIAVSSKKAPSDKLRRAEKAAPKAALILVKLPPEERQELLRLLDTPGIRSFLDDAILKCEKARAPSGDCQDSDNECKDPPTYCPSIHEMAGPARELPKSIHDVPESEVVK